MVRKKLRPSVMRTSEWWKQEKRNAEEWQNAREQVLRRDNWTCVYCGFRAYKFVMVNHIGAEDRHELENLETICKPCHSVLHMGIHSSQGHLTVIESDADQAEIIRQTRQFVHLHTPWPTIEQKILELFLKPNGKVYSNQESVDWANKLLFSIPQNEFRGFLPDGLAVVFHEEGPWNGFPEAVHKWGYRNF